MRKLEDTWVVVIAILAAMLLASNQLSHSTNFGLIGNYLYWICRILAEAAIFMAVLIAVERYLGEHLPTWGTYVLAILLSLIPFALTVTAFDLVVGLPELGLNSDLKTEASTATAFGYELGYLLDNHVVLCLMLLLPRLIAANISPRTEAKVAFSDSEANDWADRITDDSVPNVLFDSLDPPLVGELSSVEAQEHYIQVVTSEESRMILYRFSDAVRQLPDSLGMQVHRSHWIAHEAVRGVSVQSQAVKIELNDGRFIPVSRTFRQSVEARYKHTQ